MVKMYTFTIKEEQIEALNDYSKKTMIPKSAVIRRAINRYLDEVKNERTKTRNKGL